MPTILHGRPLLAARKPCSLMSLTQEKKIQLFQLYFLYCQICKGTALCRAPSRKLDLLGFSWDLLEFKCHCIDFCCLSACVYLYWELLFKNKTKQVLVGIFFFKCSSSFTNSLAQGPFLPQYGWVYWNFRINKIAGGFQTITLWEMKHARLRALCVCWEKGRLGHLLVYENRTVGDICFFRVREIISTPTSWVALGAWLIHCYSQTVAHRFIGSVLRFFSGSAEISAVGWYVLQMLLHDKSILLLVSGKWQLWMAKVNHQGPGHTAIYAPSVVPVCMIALFL